MFFIGIGNYKFWPFALSMVISGITTMAVTVDNSYGGMAAYSIINGLSYGKFFVDQIDIKLAK